MTPLAQDVEAVRWVLGTAKPTHAKCAGLVGTQWCTHALAGSGKPTSQYGSALSSEFLNTPYRHHIYKADPTKTTLAGKPACQCGNSMENPVHTPCWDPEWRNDNV